MLDFMSIRGLRLKTLREARGMSQAQLAQVMGFKDRQTVSAIEMGERSLSAKEMLLATQAFGVSVDDFMDRISVTGMAQFSWRTDNGVSDVTAELERRIGDTIGIWRGLANRFSETPSIILPRIGITGGDSVTRAADLGRQLAGLLELGSAPSLSLLSAVENRLDMLVIACDMPESITCVSCRLPEMNAIVVNQTVTGERLIADVAHQLFHLLTWDAMMPDRIDSRKLARSRPKRHMEAMTDAFAEALLHQPYSPVSVEAYFSAQTADTCAVPPLTEEKPRLFSSRYMRVVGEAMHDGWISPKLVAKRWGMTIDKAVDVYNSYVGLPYKRGTQSDVSKVVREENPFEIYA